MVLTGEREERRHGWRDGEGTERMRYGGMGKGRGETYLSLCYPPDSSQRQLEREREGERREMKAEREGKTEGREREKRGERLGRLPVNLCD